MALPSELVAEFAKITNDGKDSRKEVTVYGTISIQNGVNYVKLDGSDELTPVTSTVSIKDGERVIVTLKQHQAVVTSNLTDPAASSMMVGDIGIKVDEMGVWINGITTFTTENGKTIIDGGNIKTDTLELTGAIKWSDLDSDTQSTIGSISNTASTAYNSANSAYNLANTAYGIAISNTVPSYIKSTYIDSVTIQSPTIEGNNISVYGTFQTKGNVNGYITTTGYMGAARGSQQGETTYGVALASTWDSNSLQVSNSYLIVTDAGVRMQYGSHSFVLSANGAHYNGKLLDNLFSSSATAVFA